MLSSRHLKTRGLKLQNSFKFATVSSECDVTRLRWLRGHTAHYPANGSRSLRSLLSPLLTLSTLFTPHSAHIVTIPHPETRSGFFLLCVWIIRVPSHMLSSSLATNGYWVVSHWITTQYILLTSDSSLTSHSHSHHPLIMSLPSVWFPHVIVCICKSSKVLMLETLCIAVQ